MATLALGTSLTLAELMRRETPDGNLADLVDVLNETNAITQDATWIPCNRRTMHQDTQTASEPSGETRIYDQGVAVEAGVSQLVTEPTEMLDGRSNVDAAKMDHQPGGAGPSRTQEDGFFLRGMTKTFVGRLFSGNRAINVGQINGINNRSDYNALSSDYVFDNAGGNASATVNKTSIYIIQWGMKQVNLIYPRNDAPNGSPQFPISQEDLGRDLVVDERVSTKQFLAYRTYFQIHFGIFIHDPRTIKRIVNISTTNIDGVDDFSFDEDLLIEAITELENDGAGAVMYINKTVFAQMAKRANEKGNAQYTMDVEGEGPFAKRVLRFWGIPFKRVDQITSTQETVS